MCERERKREKERENLFAASTRVAERKRERGGERERTCFSY